MQHGAYELHENKPIWFSSKKVNKSVNVFDFTGCIYVIIGYPATAYEISTCHKALSNTRGLGLSSLIIPLHRDL